jgi:glucose-6-phosphate 1-epimerase
MTAKTKRKQTGEPAGRVTFLDGQNELPMIEVSTAWSAAEVYLHGAHVTSFRKKDEPPLLFMSQCSRFAAGEPIRGGVPIVFPWFGPREGFGQHGFARIKQWDLKSHKRNADGSVSLRFLLPECPEASALPSFSAEYVVTVAEDLTLELIVVNKSASEPLNFENCLHTYFAVGDATAISITGLKGGQYLDKVENFAQKTETAEAIRVSSAVNRIYLNTTGTVEITDPRLSRKIRVEKRGSASTVVWNPWIEQSQQMPDFGDDEYQGMVCVETGNVSPNQITLPPGQTSTLFTKLSTERLG